MNEETILATVLLLLLRTAWRGASYKKQKLEKSSGLYRENRDLVMLFFATLAQYCTMVMCGYWMTMLCRNGTGNQIYT